MFLRRLRGWLRRKPPATATKPPSMLDINQALKWAYQTGVANGEKHQPPIVYARFCEEHQMRLHELQPGVFLCPICRHKAYPQQDTDPLLTKRPFLAYREATHHRPGPSTELHRAHRVKSG